LVGGNLLLDRVMPHVYPPAIQEKFDYYAAHADGYDVLFVGSSYMHNHLIPEVFDDEMRKQGIEVRSLNLGMFGMQFHEMDLFADALLRVQPKNLRLMVVDGANMKIDLAPENHFTDRTLWWHTPGQTRAVSRAIQSAPITKGDPRERINIRIRHAALRTFHVGQGPRYLRRLFRDVPTEMPYGGFDSLDQSFAAEVPATIKRRDDFLKLRDWYTNQVTQLKAGTLRKDDRELPLPYLREAYTDQVARLSDRGPELVYLVPPLPKSIRGIHTLTKEGVVPTTLRFDLPNTYPQFYALEARFDTGHLIESAAEEYTRLVAQQLAPTLREAP
jgi:hypothetical protein